MSTSVRLENLTVSYNRHPAVHHFSGVFEAGSLTAVAGPNGAGKSTLLKAIAGILPTDGGRIIVEGGARMAFLPQAADVARDFPMDISQLVASGLWHEAGNFRAITSAQRQKVSQALADVGLGGLERRDLSSLSSGQFQRALFARLMVQDAQLILLDEPFTAIDAATTEHLLAIIARWHTEGRTVICVLHDFEQIRNHFPRCLLMARDCIAWDDSKVALSVEKLASARFFREGWSANPEICGVA